MDLPKISGGGMFDSVKSKLGFGQQDTGARRGGYNDYYDGGYDDYSDPYDGYDDYGYEGDYNNGYPDYVGGSGTQQPSSRYEPYGQVTTRSANSSLPRLVSIDDVRASTQVPASLNRDPLPPRRTTATSSSFRTLVNDCAPAPNSPADVSQRRERSESLDDLFEPTAAAAPASSRSGLGSSPLAASSVKSSYDPYDAYAGKASSSKGHTPQRNLKVLHPLSYGDVEQVAKILRAGDAAVLALDATPADLSKRILDFSFGVASALDASVDCISSKVFFIAAGAGLSEVERMHLRAQGVL